jgi:y4mF family transcriptional regulator
MSNKKNTKKSKTTPLRLKKDVADSKSSSLFLNEVENLKDILNPNQNVFKEAVELISKSGDATEALKEVLEASGVSSFSEFTKKANNATSVFKEAMEFGGTSFLANQIAEKNSAMDKIFSDNLRSSIFNFPIGASLSSMPSSNEYFDPKLASASISSGVGRKHIDINSVAKIGKLIRDKRKNLGMNQQRFADLAGVGRRFVSELENGKETLEFAKVIDVCEAAGIDLFARSR